jgi:hypothetical protein
MKRRSGYNPKRKIAAPDAISAEQLGELVRRCHYGGNPEHKRDPGDFGLTPPASPRPGKTLCDGSGQISKAQAEQLLSLGIGKCMVSEQTSGEWPRNVWAISDAGEVFEAQLENKGQGVYHGYPMPLDDDFRDRILEEWRRR